MYHYALGEAWDVMLQRGTVTKVAVVDDHAFVSAALAAILADHPSLQLVGDAPTVPALLTLDLAPDLVVLDLRLADGSSPVNNVGRLRDAGAEVLAYTSAEHPQLIRAAAKTPLLGLVRKSAPLDTLVDALEAAATGFVAPSADLASALSSDPEVKDAGLSDQESRVLALFADGLKTQIVSSELGIAPGTVEDYVRRIRAKYARVGRPAHNKVDLYKRALEDGLLRSPSE
ncbi:response regulator transcription factor [Subtercola sp. PAMC28395]|uniref:response regulator transcription factor n=1 Tax=Subtercola sp. PAMC28395 TaxID=2846775 RepID=UPI001C0C4AAC|nr:response regulator transcription factor [Subtercola sp. PAMC28395]QWT24558.1 response regulator transcription factor [Subtercola sp. PAMC28395]